MPEKLWATLPAETVHPPNKATLEPVPTQQSYFDGSIVPHFICYAWLRHMHKIPHQASFARNFLKLLLLCVVFALVFFSFLLLWEFEHDKIYNLHSQTEAWW